MSFASFFDAIARRPTVSHASVWLPDPEPATPAARDLAEGYFQLRLSQMFLADSRHWLKEIMPAALLVADYNYGTEKVSHPFFLSNAMLKGMEPAGGNKIRVVFKDTPIFGPIPYIGGEVALFVGLYKSTIADQRKELFNVFETIFSAVDIGGMSQYLKLADKLTATVTDFLGGSDMECLLAERRPVIKQGKAGSGYLVLLAAREGGHPDLAELAMEKEQLVKRVAGGNAVPVEDRDFCVVRVERQDQRDDVLAMPFHATWTQARKKMLGGQVQEAQALMLVAGNQILDSPDLTENHKVRLLKFYQAKLMTFLQDDDGTDTGGATRSGGREMFAEMSAQAGRSAAPQADKMRRHMMSIANMSTAMAAPEAGGEEDDARLAKELKEQLAQPRLPDDPSARDLVRALANSSVIAPHPAGE